ncbi:MAG: cupin domain-containing protein [Marinilabiliales bacterium]
MCIIIEQLNKDELTEKGVLSWPIWEKEVSEFDWYYDATEECYILEGEVEVDTGTKKYLIKSGDFVRFEKGLSCKWNIKKDIRKHYFFPKD